MRYGGTTEYQRMNFSENVLSEDEDNNPDSFKSNCEIEFL
jgi:hypothetical protein